MTAQAIALVGGNGTAHLTVTGPTLQSIAVTDADNGVAAVGTGDQFTAIGTYSDQSTQNLTSYVAWTSSVATVATIPTGGSTAGLASPFAAGDTLISASVTIGSASPIAGSEVLTVGTLKTITVTDADMGAPPPASTDQFTAMGNYAGSTTPQDITTFVTWGSDNTASVSFAGGNGVPPGNATTGVVGQAHISASLTPGVGAVAVKGTETVNVEGTAPTLTMITVTPAGASVAAGLTQQYLATGTYSDGTMAPITSGVTWAAVATPAGAVTINSSSGLATGVTAGGTATITATVGTIASPGVTLTVTAAVLQSITVTPSTASIPVGGTQTYIATGNYSDGSHPTLTTGVTWLSTPISVASISSSGVATGVSKGTATISATYGGLGSGPATLTVNAAQATVPRYLFEVNADNTISDYAVLPSTGQLRSVSYFGIPALTVGGTAVNPVLPVIYMVQSDPMTGVTQLSTFPVTAGGQISNAGATTANLSDALALDPLGRYLYGTDNTDHEIALFALDPTSGLPTAGTGSPITVTATELAIDPAGAFLYMEDNVGSIHSYQIGTGGALTAVGTPPSSHPQSGRQEIAVDPSGNFLLAIDAATEDSMYEYSISAGVLSPVAGSPFTIGSIGGNISQFVFDPAASFLYAIDDANNQLLGYAFSGSGLTPIAGSPFASPADGIPLEINVDPSGKLVFVSYETTGEVWTYNIASGGSAPGALTPVSKMRLHSSIEFAQLLSSGTAAVTFTPTALYIANSATPGGTIQQFTIDASTGNLTTLATPIGAGDEPLTVATDPFGLYAFDVANGGNPNVVGSVFAYSIISTGLDFNNINIVGAGKGPSWLTTDLSGSFLYATMQTDNTVWKYDLVSGVPTSGASAMSTHGGPVFVTTDPTGAFLYVGDSTAATIDVFSINLPDGSLSPIAGGSVTQGLSQNWIAIDPSGRFAYSADPQFNAVWEFTIDGALTLNSTSHVALGPNHTTPGASSVVVEPTGKFLYATNEIMSQIYAFTIDPSTGLLTQVSTGMSNGQVANTDPSPTGLAVDISGKFLYCVNAGATAQTASIDIFAIDLTTGLLTPVATVPDVAFAAGFTTTGTLQ